jgi:hypothetical protein
LVLKGWRNRVFERRRQPLFLLLFGKAAGVSCERGHDSGFHSGFSPENRCKPFASQDWPDAEMFIILRTAVETPPDGQGSSGASVCESAGDHPFREPRRS